MDLSLLGWRDLILLLVVAVAIYMVVMVLKLARLRPSRGAAGIAEPRVLKPQESDTPLEPLDDAVPGPTLGRETAMSAYAEMQDAAASEPAEKFAVSQAPTFAWDDVKELFGEAAATRTPPAEAAPQRRGGFGESLAEHLARSDMEMELQRMREEMARMHREMEELRAARRVSPQYAEAMELSQRGFSAQDVADRLGISLAEAELVQALSRGKQNFD